MAEGLQGLALSGQQLKELSQIPQPEKCDPGCAVCRMSQKAVEGLRNKCLRVTGIPSGWWAALGSNWSD